MPSIEWMFLYLLLGSFVGFMAGLIGVAGGGILVPILTSMFLYQGMSVENVFQLALGTSMASMIISSSASLRAHNSRGAVLWKAVKGIAPGIVVASFLSTYIASNVNSVYIAIFFILFMSLISAQAFFNWSLKPSQESTSYRGLLFVGSGIGLVSSLAAVGGGILTITYLTYKNVEIKKAIGTSSAIGLTIAVAGSLGYLINGWSKTLGDIYSFGFIYLPAFISISLSCYFAAPYGVRLSHKLPDIYLKNIFAIISLGLSVKMLFSII